jgi:hypothetical protein
VNTELDSDNVILQELGQWLEISATFALRARLLALELTLSLSLSLSLNHAPHSRSRSRSRASPFACSCSKMQRAPGIRILGLPLPEPVYHGLQQPSHNSPNTQVRPMSLDSFKLDYLKRVEVRMRSTL